MTVLAGDWLYMQSFAVALGEKNLHILDSLIEITQRMVEGELLQLTFLGRSDLTDSQMLDLVERKTAYLFSGCTKLPALSAGLSMEAANRLSAVGKNLGMAFQLIDDLLDLTSTQATLGKPVASDLREGKMTLPVWFVVRSGVQDEIGKIQRVLDERDFRSVESLDILRLVEKWDGLNQTRLLAENYSMRAKSLLNEFPPSAYRDAIASIPDFILNRRT